MKIDTTFDLLEFRTSEQEIFAHRHDYYPSRESFGSLDGFFRSRTRATPYPLSFCHEKFSSLEEWRPQALAALESALRRPQEHALIGADCQKVVHAAQWTREEWTLKTSTSQDIPLTVLKPNDDSGPYPAILALHDMGGNRLYGREKLFSQDSDPAYLRKVRDVYYSGRGWAEVLVQEGYMVFIIDAIGFGERLKGWPGGVDDILRRRATLTEADVPDAVRQIMNVETGAARSALLAGTTWGGMVVQDDIITLDYMCSRPDVDTSRIGCTGLSFGSYRSNYLAAVDERIRAAVSVCWHSSIKGLMGYNVSGSIGWFSILPELFAKMDISDIASLACPRAFLAISGWKDPMMQPLGAVDAHRTLRRVWDKAGCPENLGSRIFPCAHEYNQDMQELALAWFQQKLSPES